VHQKLSSQNQRKEIQKENVCHQFEQMMLSQKKNKEKERKEEYDLGKNMNCFS